MLANRRTERAVGAVAAVLGGIFVLSALALATGGFDSNALEISPSVVIGGVAGLALIFAAAGLFGHRRWGWGADIGAHMIGIGAAVLALSGLASRDSDAAQSGTVITGGLLVLLLISLFTLFRARPRQPLRRARHQMAAKMY